METPPRAQTIPDAFNAVNPDVALPADDTRYVDFTEWRGHQPVAFRMARRIEMADREANYLKLLFTGHRGSGKSTELLRLQERLEEQGFFVVYFDSAAVLDPNNVDYTDVLLATMYHVVAAVDASDLGLTIDSRAVDKLYQRLGTLTVEKEIERETSTELTAGAEVKTGIPGLVSLLAGLTTRLRGGVRDKQALRVEIDQDIVAFQEDLNDVIRDLRLQLKDRGKRGPVIIVDSLDRITLRADAEATRDSHTALFIDHAEQLKSPDCHIVYTLPVALLWNQNVNSSYSDTPSLLPMVKVQDRDNRDCAGALDLLETAVGERMDLGLFEDTTDLRDLCRLSGGHIRDLMRLLRDACVYAEGDRISAEATRQARRSFVNAFGRLVPEAALDTLVEIHRTKTLPNRPENAALLHQLLVLEYHNDEEWHDVHPAVLQTRAFRQAWEARSDA